MKSHEEINFKTICEKEKIGKNNLNLSPISGVVCKVYQQESNEWLTGRILFGQINSNTAFVKFNQQNLARWVDFGANSSDAVLFSTDYVMYKNRLARKYRGSIRGLTQMRCFNDGNSSYSYIILILLLFMILIVIFNINIIYDSYVY